MELYPAIGVYGYPKSGNTWIQGVFAELAKQAAPDYQQYDIHINRRNKTPFVVHPVVKLSGRPCIVFKSHEQYDEKTSAFEDAADLGVSHVEKVILVKRNPFDMLLSYINYALWAVKRNRDSGARSAPNTERYVRDVLGLDDRKMLDVTRSTDVLASMKKAGACDAALKSFADDGFLLEPFRKSYGGWLNHITSWERQSRYEVLSLRYEDLVNDLEPQVENLSRYIDIPAEQVSAAFAKRERATSNVRSRDNNSQQVSFYNKCTAGYFWDYFSTPLIEKILQSYKNEFDSAGYGDLTKICPLPLVGAQIPRFGIRIPFFQSR